MNNFNLHKKILGDDFNSSKLVDIGKSHGEKFDGAYCGISEIDENSIAFVLQDFTFKGGSVGLIQNQQIQETIAIATKHRIPLLISFSSGGARFQDGFENITLSISTFRDLAIASKSIPIIGVINGICVGLSAYFAAICDVCIFVQEESNAFMTGPKVIEAVLGQKTNLKDLGNAITHAEKTGLATHLFSSWENVVSEIKLLIHLFSPSKIKEFTAREFSIHLPIDKRYTYDMMTVIHSIMDNGTLSIFNKEFAPNLITCLAKFYGQTVGIVANQPKYLSGAMDTKSAEKLTRFTSFCNRRKIPMIFLLDCPGFLPGDNQEAQGVIIAGTKAAINMLESPVKRVSIILRRLTGGAVLVLNSIRLGAEKVAIWQEAEVSYIRNDIHQKLTRQENFHENTLSDLKNHGIVHDIISSSNSIEYLYNALYRE